MNEKDSLSNPSQNESKTLSPKDTLLKSIDEQLRSSDKISESGWSKLTGTKIENSERDEAWEVIHKQTKKSRDLRAYKVRINSHIFDAFDDDKLNHIKEELTELSDMAESLGLKLRKITHAEDCGVWHGCPTTHPQCKEQLNVMSPVYWMAALELEEISNIMFEIIKSCKYKNYFPILFGTTQLFYRISTLYSTLDHGSYHGQHLRFSTEEYSEIRGLERFYELRNVSLYGIKYQFRRLSDFMTEIGTEMMNIAEAGQIEEQSE